jgi:hypothetical protein
LLVAISDGPLARPSPSVFAKKIVSILVVDEFDSDASFALEKDRTWRVSTI